MSPEHGREIRRGKGVPKAISKEVFWVHRKFGVRGSEFGV
jgi:hypothetical protein